MSVELEEAKTKVAQFQKQCEEYLVTIVHQKREADEQQKVCTRDARPHPPVTALSLTFPLFCRLLPLVARRSERKRRNVVLWQKMPSMTLTRPSQP